MACPCSFVSYNRCTTLAGNAMRNLCTFHEQFCCEPKTTLKKIFFKLFFGAFIHFSPEVAPASYAALSYWAASSEDTTILFSRDFNHLFNGHDSDSGPGLQERTKTVPATEGCGGQGLSSWSELETGLSGGPPVCPAPRSLLEFVSLILPTTSPAPAPQVGVPQKVP